MKNEPMLRLVKKLLNEDPDIVQIKNCATIASLSRSSNFLKYIGDVGTYCEEKQNISSGDIVFVDLSPKFFRYLYQIENNDYDILELANASLMGVFKPSNSTIFDRSINVFGGFKMDKHKFNIMDLLKVKPPKTPNESIDDNSSVSRFVDQLACKYIFAGEDHYLIGIISISGILYVFSNTCRDILNQFLVSYDEEEANIKFLKMIKNMFLIYFQLNRRYLSDNIMSVVENDIFNVVYKNIVLNHINKIDVSYVDEDKLDLFGGEDQCGILLDKIKLLIKQEINESLKETCFGKNFKYSYAEIINSVVNLALKKKMEANRHSFNQGLMIGSKLEMYGWRLATEEEISCMYIDSSEIVWIKDVDIRPRKFIFESKYKVLKPEIEKDSIPYQITRLYLNHSGVMYALGNHPNVSTSKKVCMGDLAGKIKLDEISSLANNLRVIEELLETINFDSSYSSRYLYFYNENSVEVSMDSKNSNKSDFVPEGDNVCSEIVYMDDEDDEDAVEINTNDGEIS